MFIRLPTGEILDTLKGDNLLQTLKRHGIYLVASCGGKGICGKCRVKIISGRYTISSKGKLNPEEVSSGITLACQTYPDEDLIIDIPKESKIVVGDIIEISKANELFDLFKSLDGNISPLLKRLVLEIDPPTLNNNISDLERLKKALEEKGLKDMRFSHDFIAGLAKSIRNSGWKVIFAYTEALEAIFITPVVEKKRYGMAVDVGTTTIVVYLVDLENGHVIDVGSTYNSQIRFGDDVITRIVYATESNGLNELRDAVVNDVNNLLTPIIERHKIDSDDIESAVISGNTTMSHLFWGLNPKYIREEPYTPTLNTFPLWTAKTAGLNINPNAPLYTVPCVASYIGGDIVAGVLASKLHRKDEISIFMDIGTNGEIVIGNKDWLITAACSAGPCFEGSGIRHGMRATKGAIESITLDTETLEPSLKIIGDTRPIGICGSGMIDAITELFLSGVIDQKGKFLEKPNTERIRIGFEGPEFVIYSDGQKEIVLTEVDIENIIRAKAAIYAGVSLLLKKTGFTFNDIDNIYIAGGFGNYLNVEKAIIIGMLPDLPKEKFIFLGNTSIAGAYLCLLSEKMRGEAEEIAQKMTNVELSVSRRFMEEYLSALFLPHTDIGLFPSVEKLISKNIR